MIIQQLSVFLENKKGSLCAAVDILAQNGVDISALSLGDAAEFGVLRLLVDQPEKARQALAEQGITVRLTRVVAVAMSDAPGGAVGILRLLSGAGINVEYMYACVGRISGKALMVLRPDDVTKTEQVLQQAGFSEQNPSEIYRIQ